MLMLNFSELVGNFWNSLQGEFIKNVVGFVIGAIYRAERGNWWMSVYALVGDMDVFSFINK